MRFGFMLLAWSACQHQSSVSSPAIQASSSALPTGESLPVTLATGGDSRWTRVLNPETAAVRRTSVADFTAQAAQEYSAQPFTFMLVQTNPATEHPEPWQTCRGFEAGRYLVPAMVPLLLVTPLGADMRPCAPLSDDLVSTVLVAGPPGIEVQVLDPQANAVFTDVRDIYLAAPN